MQRRLFGTNGIRGVVNKELTPQFVIKISEAIGTFFNGGEILLGYDGRTSSPALAKAVASGLASTGCTVYLAGMAPTPALQYAVKKHKLDGGVIITASHNPPEYNGIKVLGNDGVEISRSQEIEIEKIFFEEKQKKAEWNKIGQYGELTNIIEEYVEAVKDHVDVEEIKRKNFRVVVDPGNGVGSLAAPKLLRELECKVFTINANIDGSFPGRPSEPRPENLEDLMRIVKTLKADFGVAYDGDADRAIFVDENGNVHWGDRTFALIEKEFLKRNPGETIVTPVSSSSIVKDIADIYNGRVVWTKVGSVDVSHKMKEIGAKLGGEENGGVFYGPHQPVRDGAMTTALILEILAKTERKLSELLNELPKYFIEKDKVNCPNELKTKVLEKLYEELKKENLNFDTIDGAKIWFKDSSILVRPSGTEPIFRLYSEAKTQNKASNLIKEYKEKLRNIIAKLT